MKETRTSTAEEFVTYKSVEARSGAESHCVGGTLFGKSSPRLVLADGFELEVEPAGTILFIRNEDVPGVIGEVGRILGDHKINIGNMNNGRKSVGGEALTVVTVDTEPDETVVDELTRVPSIVDVRVVRLR
jgi:D-3-phosphoglycerate dehydrogenase